MVYLTDTGNTAKSRPKQQCANSAPPSPEKHHSAKVAASTLKASCPMTLKPRRNNTFESNNDNKILDSDNCKEDEEEVCKAEDEVVEEPMEKYEKMKEDILHERMVSHTFFRSMYPLLTSAFSHCENTSIGEKIHVCKTYRQCLSLVKSRTSQQGRLRRAISCLHVCTCNFI